MRACYALRPFIMVYYVSKWIVHPEHLAQEQEPCTWNYICIGSKNGNSLFQIEQNNVYIVYKDYNRGSHLYFNNYFLFCYIFLIRYIYGCTFNFSLCFNVEEWRAGPPAGLTLTRLHKKCQT